jgi:hypothetical protein
MKLLKFKQFFENKTILNDTPESYIFTAISAVKAKFEKMFSRIEPPKDENGRNLNSKDKDNKTSLETMGVTLDECEVSKSPKLANYLSVKYSDAEYQYSLYLQISIEEAISDKEDKEFDWKSIDDAFIKFKKYRIEDMKMVGQITKNIKLDSIGDDFLIQLNVELDNDFESDDEEFEIEK